MIHGTAKIVTNAGGGKYTITQTFIDSTTSTYKAGTVGLVAVDAWDANLDSSIAVDDTVVFQMQESYDGKLVPIISSGGPATGYEPITLDKWYDIQADQIYADFDDRDWSGRFIDIAAQYKFDSGAVAGIQWAEAAVEHRDTLTSTYVNQVQNEWFRIWLKDGGTAQEITRILQGGADTEMTIRMNTDGALQFKIENHNANMTVRFWIRSSAKILYSDAEDIT